MSKSSPPRWRSKSSAILRYAIAVLSVATAIVVAELLTVFLHTEPIASSMISAVMFVAWFGGFGPGLLAIALAVLAIHYYVVPPLNSFALNSFALKNNLFSLGVAELPRLVLFAIAALFITFLSSAQRTAAGASRQKRSACDAQPARRSCDIAAAPPPPAAIAARSSPSAPSKSRSRSRRGSR